MKRVALSKKVPQSNAAAVANQGRGGKRGLPLIRIADLGSLTRVVKFGRKEPTPDGLAVIEFLAEKGMGEVAIMHCVGISSATWSEWKERHPELMEVLTRGKARGLDLATEVIHRHMLAGDLTAAIYFTKVHAGWRDHDRAETYTPHPPAIVDGYLRQCTDDELRQIADIVRRASARAIIEGAATAVGRAVST